MDICGLLEMGHGSVLKKADGKPCDEAVPCWMVRLFRLRNATPQHFDASKSNSKDFFKQPRIMRQRLRPIPASIATFMEGGSRRTRTRFCCHHPGFAGTKISHSVAKLTTNHPQNHHFYGC